MKIIEWTTAALSMFNLQFSYLNSTNTNMYFQVVNKSLQTCVHKYDSAFKIGSPTFPRTELRSLEEKKNGTYTLRVHVNSTNVTDPNFDYSYYQLFGRKPILMIRKRLGQLQMVTFDLKPKIQVLTSLPKECNITCGNRNSIIQCDSFISKGRMKCRNKLHLKLGIYSQQMHPTDTYCIKYNEIYFN